MSDIESPSKEYDTLVCSAIRKDPLSFVDILQKEAERAEKGERPSRDFSPVLREAACVVANLLLTDEEWHKIPKLGELRIKEVSPGQLFQLYQEKYMDDHDPIINYRPHETIPYVITVEHDSGFERNFYVTENLGANKN